MAERTTSSITIAVGPSRVIEVIADFASYPEWAGQVKSAQVLTTVPADGRRRSVSRWTPA